MTSNVTARFLTIPNVTAGFRALSDWLPKSQHDKNVEQYAKNIASLNNEIHSLAQSLNTKTGTVFKSKVKEVADAVQKEKENCRGDLLALNGSYYEDPRSALKGAWDELVQSAYTAIGFKVERSDQLDALAELLYNDPCNVSDPDGKKESANKKIKHYKDLETMRNRRQAQLNQILATEKVGLNLEETLKNEKAMQEQMHLKLCGHYFGDPQGQLDQAWQTYQNEKSHGLEGEESLAAYQALDESRKKIEAELYKIEQRLSTPVSHHTFEQLTIESINKQIQAFTKELKLTPAPTKKDKSTKVITAIAIDELKRRIAATATKAALTSASYIVKVNSTVLS
jgi:hypothetical protein